MARKEQDLGTPRFWDVFVVREDGKWAGFRTPWQSLERTATFFSVVFLLFSLSFFGWLISRWQVVKLDRELSHERLRSRALEGEIDELKKTNGTPTSKADAQSASFLPSLDTTPVTSALIEVADLVSEYDFEHKEWNIRFDVVRPPPREGSMRFFWVALLHGSQGILSFPPAIASRGGEALLFHRGNAIDDVKTRRSVSQKYKLDQFIDRSGAEPVYVTLLVYDQKGALLTKTRSELSMIRGGGSSK